MDWNWIWKYKICLNLSAKNQSFFLFKIQFYIFMLVSNVLAKALRTKEIPRETTFYSIGKRIV